MESNCPGSYFGVAPDGVSQVDVTVRAADFRCNHEKCQYSLGEFFYNFIFISLSFFFTFALAIAYSKKITLIDNQLHQLDNILTYDSITHYNEKQNLEFRIEKLEKDLKNATIENKLPK